MVFSPKSQTQRTHSLMQLSHVTINDIHIGIDYQVRAREQRHDLETDTYKYKTAITNLKWQYVSIDDTKLLFDVSTGRPRPLVLNSFRRRLFNTIHGLPYPSIRSTIQVCMANNIRECAHCRDTGQRCKIHRHTKTVLVDFPQPQRRFSHIDVDIV